MWKQEDNGETLGQIGSEGGCILMDESMDDLCRITLEEGGIVAPFSITCGIYGRMVHTAFACDLANATEKYEGMKQELAAFLCSEDDGGDGTWCQNFASKW